MARDTSLSVDVDQGRDSTHNGLQTDLISALWEQAPFARLPSDAPHEVKDFLANVENPKRVYTIHKASRRHGFQLLVQNYIIQLRDGCGVQHCTTSTCFTCRKRVAGQAPVRRFSPTSARTLAICLAQQDNAESGLCPGLQPPKTAPAAVNSLLFTPNTKPPSRDPRSISIVRGQDGAGAGSVVLERGKPRMKRSASKKEARRGTTNVGADHSDRTNVECGTKADFSAAEQPARKDYRSFAANVFSTVSFKMLEWLTPNAIAEMHRKTETFQANVQANSRDNHENVPKLSATATAKETDAVSAAGLPVEKSTRARSKEAGHRCQGSRQSSPRPGNITRDSNTQVSRQQGTRPKRQLSIEPIPHDGLGDEPFAGHLKSPKRLGQPVEMNTRCLKASNPIPRPISQLSSAGFFDEVIMEKMPPPLLCTPKGPEKRSKLEPSHADGPRSSESSSLSGHEFNVTGGPMSSKCCSDNEGQSDSEHDNLLPQTLTRLSPDVINFVCDVLQEDGTAEKHMLEPANASKIRHKCTGQGKVLKRKIRPYSTYSPNLKLEWHLFIEQSFFYILSDPNLVVRSFSKKGVLYDSHTLWYCMLRITRVAPSLLFHSLWLAAAHLFAAPKSLQSLRSPTARLFPRHEEPLSNFEAGCLMSICLHALVAAGPLVSRAQDFFDVSRIRSHGLSIGSGAVAQPPVSLCLQYDDAFTNELALRLARRLFAAITTRRYFDEIIESREEFGHREEADVLAPIFSQLNFMNPDNVYILDFPFSERTLHETRVPSLLLDWSKTIIMNDWDGNAQVPGDGPFGGALSLIEAMHQRRQDLALGDTHFKCEYFADRLDDVDMPVAWLSHVSTRQKRHLLDFPFLFNSSTLVSYFRSIHFSRMNRAFEESNSLQSRIGAITNTGSLVVNIHHKDVLHEMLKTASAKYLVLDISRENVIRDAFDQLWRRDERELLRPLKVHLGERNGEEGLDSGGVQLEFFRLAMAEVLNPDYGMFAVDERTRMAWFQPGSVVDEWKFEMVGLLVSLAVYNGLTLPVTFPKALYRKLLGEPVNDLQHVADGWPDLASGLSKLLEWDEKDGRVDDVFLVTYDFSVSVLGKPVTRNMHAEARLSPSQSRSFFSSASGSATPDEDWPQFSRGARYSAGEQGSSAADDDNNSNHNNNNNNNNQQHEAPLVTKANRDAYVADYIRYLTDVSVRPQYEAFARGFRTCLHPKSLSLLTSNLLQSIVEGVQDMDVHELQRHARHVGWDATHETVVDFWSIVAGYDDAMKRRLLEFVTASDRVPVGGIKNLQFIVQKNGVVDHDGGHLPTAYTCYGTLLLPEYRDRKMLEERLNMALQNAQGFGFG